MASRLIKIKGEEPYYDLGTANKSFVILARDLKKLGVKNYYFMLALYDPSLINVDPYSVDPKTGICNLTKDEIERIALECMRNPWYYLRELARIPDQGGTAVPYIANRGNIAQAWCIINHLDSWLCLRRQKGKTQSALSMIDWMYLFGTSNSQCIFVNKDGDNAKENLRRLRDQTDLLPSYLHADSIVEEDGKRVKSTKNATKISNAINRNSIITKPKATSYDKALSLARGLTAPILHFDEPEFTDHIQTIVDNSVSTFATAAENAAKNHAAYCRIFTCTPGDLDTQAGQEAQKLLDRTLKWSESFYDKGPEYVRELFAKMGEGCNEIIYIEYMWNQIGDTREWLASMKAKITDPLVFRREILLQRLHGSSLSPFDQEDIQYLYEIQKKPVDELWVTTYCKFDIYKPLSKRIPYIIGVDCSSGTGSDNNAITIINPYTMEPDAEFESPYIGETMYEELLKTLVLDIIPRGVLCIERNNVGDGIIDHLMHSPVSNRLYFDRQRDLMDEKMSEYEEIKSILKKQAIQKRFYGVYTTGKSRDTMMAILTRHVHEYKDKFVTANITRDIGRLVRTKSGKIEAGLGFHDDSIMSYLIGMYVYYHGDNLEYYGIRKEEQDFNDLNQGMKRPDEIDTELVAPELIEEVKQNEQNFFNYEELMRNVVRRGQAETFKRQRKMNVKGTEFENSPDEVIEDAEDSLLNRTMDAFDSLNGIGPQEAPGQDDVDFGVPIDPWGDRGSSGWGW